MSIVLRFVNNKGEVIERFLGVVHVRDTSSKSLKESIDDFFAKHGLSFSKIRGQGYDGASNMRGEFNGLKALILNENFQAHYVHFFAHRLQLVIVTTSKDHALVSNFFDHLIMIVNLIGALCKRRDALRQKYHDDLVQCIDSGVIDTGKGKNQETGLAQPGDSRWGSHYKTISRILDMWDAIIDVLEVIIEDGIDQKSKGSAAGLVEKVLTFEFVFIAHLMFTLLAKTNALSAALP
ncbi:uncharacterized protein LOC127258093 [Andrographis paniculata]|uniref:uncharacterized protein LOC127258093 n=1 Tax=Andrographis paniculata TaxID=175694 RepID=UPI0021E7C3E9|nr:uncharacterized protein LOC127258093 [Andrographis paniculata]